MILTPKTIVENILGTEFCKANLISIVELSFESHSKPTLVVAATSLKLDPIVSDTIHKRMSKYIEVEIAVLMMSSTEVERIIKGNIESTQGKPSITTFTQCTNLMEKNREELARPGLATNYVLIGSIGIAFIVLVGISSLLRMGIDESKTKASQSEVEHSCFGSNEADNLFSCNKAGIELANRRIEHCKRASFLMVRLKDPTSFKEYEKSSSYQDREMADSYHNLTYLATNSYGAQLKGTLRCIYERNRLVQHFSD